MPPSTSPHSPTEQLLLAYDEADLMAAVHYQALHCQDYPACLCQTGATLEFKRRYRKLLAYSTTSTPASAMAYGDDFDHHLDRCHPGRDELQPTPKRWPRRAAGLFLLALLVLMHACG